MSIKDELNGDDFGGYVVVELLRDGANGPEVVHTETKHNLVVNGGKKHIWRLVSGGSVLTYRYFRLGTGATAPASADTNVKTSLTATYRIFDSRTIQAGRTYQWVVSYPSGAGSKSAASIVEVALHNTSATPGASAMMRTTFTAVNKTTADKLRITYRVRIT